MTNQNVPSTPTHLLQHMTIATQYTKTPEMAQRPFSQRLTRQRTKKTNQSGEAMVVDREETPPSPLINYERAIEESSIVT